MTGEKPAVLSRPRSASIQTSRAALSRAQAAQIVPLVRRQIPGLAATLVRVGLAQPVAQRLGRHFVGTDLNREYVELARKRVQYRGDDRRMMREQEAGVEQIALFEDGAA